MDISYFLPDIWYLLFDTFYLKLSIFLTFYILLIILKLMLLADMQNMMLVTGYLILLAMNLIPLAPIVRLALVLQMFTMLAESLTPRDLLHLSCTMYLYMLMLDGNMDKTIFGCYRPHSTYHFMCFPKNFEKHLSGNINVIGAYQPPRIMIVMNCALTLLSLLT